MSPKEKANAVVDTIQKNENYSGNLEQNLEAGWWVFGFETSRQEYFEVFDLVEAWALM